MAASRPSATTSSVGAVAPPATSSMVFSVASASTIMIATSVTGDPAGDDHVEDGLLQLGVRSGSATHWPSMSATRTPATGPENGRPDDLGGRGRGVDRQHVVELVGVERHDGDDDLDLVAQALEGRAQRPVDQPAGEDGVLGRAALAAEERAGDAPGGVHPLLDVDGQREEVELFLRVLAGAWWRSAAWCPRRGTPRRNRRPAGPAVRSRSGWCGCRTCRCRWWRRTRGVRSDTPCCALFLAPSGRTRDVAGAATEPAFDAERPGSSVPGATTEDRRVRLAPALRHGAWVPSRRVAVRGRGAARGRSPARCYRRRPSRSISER